MLEYEARVPIAKLTNLVSLFIEGVAMWEFEQMSLLEMLSNLALLETLHISGIYKPTYNVLVSPVYSCAVLSNPNSSQTPQDL